MLLSAQGVSKKFGSVAAVRSISLEVSAGEIVGLVGENGAGKTTMLRMLAGYLEPDLGRVEVAGFDTVIHHRRARARVGYIPESAPLYEDMRVAEYLGFRARLKGAHRRELEEWVGRAADRTNISERSAWIIGRLSRGWRQRVALADALLGDPPVLLLDEPTAGLDPTQVRQLSETIVELADGRAIVVSTHVLPALADLASRWVVISRGDLVAEGSLSAIRDQAGAASGSDLTSAPLGDVFAALVNQRDEPEGSR